jgi:hypothetical protein
MSKEKERVINHDRFDEEVNMTIKLPKGITLPNKKKDVDEELGKGLTMEVTPEELKKWIKGIPVNHDEEEDEISDLYELDKDDCLDRTYPGVSDKE